MISILKRVKARLHRMLYSPPHGITAGKDVIIEKPHKRIDARGRIFIGDHTYIGANPLIASILERDGIRYDPEIRIGSDVYIGPNTYIASILNVTIGDGTVLSESVYLNDASHGLEPLAGPIMKQPLIGRPITIGRNCFLGLRSAIMPGVTLGDHCVVGTNSVVTKSFPSYSMVAGVPARLIKRYEQEKQQWVRVTEEEGNPSS